MSELPSEQDNKRKNEPINEPTNLPTNELKNKLTNQHCCPEEGIACLDILASGTMAHGGAGQGEANAPQKY